MTAWSDLLNKKTTIVPAKADKDLDIQLKSFITELVNAYKENRRNPQESDIYIDIIYTRFGIGKKVETLKSIGARYGCTRERIRQKQNYLLDCIKETIENGYYEDRYCKIILNSKTARLFRSVAQKLNSEIIFSQDEFLKMFKNSKMNLPDWAISLIIELYGIRHFTYKGKLYYCNTSEDEMIKYQKRIRDIRRYCLKQKLSVKAKKLEQVFKIKDSELLDKLCKIAGLEPLRDKEGLKYTVPDSGVLKAADIAYRILYERKDKMHLNELREEFFKRAGYRSALSLNLSLDDRFKPVGRTGYWVLKEWKYNTSTYDKVVASVFEKFNKPLTVDKIYKHIVRTRSDLKPGTLHSILGTKDYVRIAPETYVTSAMAKNMGIKRQTKVRGNLSITQLSKELIEMLGDERLPLANVVNHFIRKYGVSEAGIRSKINTLNFLSKSVRGNRVFIKLKKGAEPVIIEDQREVIKSYVNDILKKEKIVELNLMIRDLSEKFNYCAPFYYKVISEMKLKKKRNERGRVVLMKNEKNTRSKKRKS